MKLNENYIKAQQISEQLKQFTGTEHYFKASNEGKLLVTDGIQFLRNELGCYWLTDICSSVQYLKRINENNTFILWKIKVNLDKSWIVRAYSDYLDEQTEEDNKKYLLYEQRGNYTSFLFDEFEFYQCGGVLLLKSEY